MDTDINILTVERIKNITWTNNNLNMKKWHAVYTRNNCEKKVSQLFNKKKIDHYLPVNRVITKINNEHEKITNELLFDSFVFVKLSENDFNVVKHLGDVINFVYWLGKPAVFSDFEIESMRNFLNHHYNICIEKVNVNTEQQIFFMSDSGIDNSGESGSTSNINSHIRLELPSLGYILVADTHYFNSQLFEQTGKIIELVL